MFHKCRIHMRLFNLVHVQGRIEPKKLEEKESTCCDLNLRIFVNS